MGKRAIEISYELWKGMFTKGWCAEKVVCIEGLPESASFIGAMIRDAPVLDWKQGVVSNLLVFEDASFQDEAGFKIPLMNGDQVLVMDIVYRNTHDD
jgi:hypothetical protein